MNTKEQGTKKYDISTYDCDNPSQHNEDATILEDQKQPMHCKDNRE